MRLLGTGSVHLQGRIARLPKKPTPGDGTQQCQNCLQVTEFDMTRAYRERPSRSKQLKDPSLRPKLLGANELMDEENPEANKDKDKNVDASPSKDDPQMKGEIKDVYQPDVALLDPSKEEENAVQWSSESSSSSGSISNDSSDEESDGADDSDSSDSDSTSSKLDSSSTSSASSSSESLPPSRPGRKDNGVSQEAHGRTTIPRRHSSHGSDVDFRTGHAKNWRKSEPEDRPLETGNRRGLYLDNKLDRRRPYRERRYGHGREQQEAPVLPRPHPERAHLIRHSDGYQNPLRRERRLAPERKERMYERRYRHRSPRKHPRGGYRSRGRQREDVHDIQSDEDRKRRLKGRKDDIRLAASTSNERLHKRRRHDSPSSSFDTPKRK